MISTTTRKGLTAAFSGTLILSFDNLLLRLTRADPFQMAFWRGILMFAGGLCGFEVLRIRSESVSSLTSRWNGSAVAAFYDFASIWFVFSATMNSIANVLDFISRRWLSSRDGDPRARTMA